jgi:sec-independent protein translocase protein TatC
MQDDNKKPILAHLDEIRIRLTKSFIAVIVCLIISFPLPKYIIPILMKPVADLDLYYTEVTGLISPYIKICLYLALAISGPYLLYHIVMFIKPALKRKEKGYLYTLLPSTVLLFLGGVVFCYFVLLPPGLTFLYRQFPEWLGGNIEPIWTVTSYISIVTQLLFWVGVVFEIPMVMFFLSKIGILSPQWAIRKWKWAVILSFFLGAIITPTPDPVNQTLVAVPILFLYLLGCFLAWFARRGMPFRSKKSKS